ncbi:tetraspanin-36-like isoform X2 [Anneissia japonica]|uniref:tetraspanin-36-like isoform X2 n=1 Tax=Anneissia japonica TaxID=1529436 RepID=UPI001425AE08|nr:tetraspanin-36-like isoform X2 [Anneissia japonica]
MISTKTATDQNGNRHTCRLKRQRSEINAKTIASGTVHAPQFAAGCLMYVGVIIFSDYKEYDKVYADYYIWVPGATIIVASVFMFILGIIACCAACKENKCLLACFFTILLLIVMMELTCGIVAIVYKGELNDAVSSGMKEAFSKYGTDDNGDITRSVDTIQETLQCCGVNNSTEWGTTQWGSDNPGQVPKSCCKTNANNCTGSSSDISKNKTNTEGCYSKVDEQLKANLKKIIGVSLGLLAFQIIGLIFSCVLFCNKKKVAYTQLDDEGTVTHGYRA